VDIIVPKWGMTMQDCIITEWLVKVGDAVVEGQALAVIETEKVDTNLESPGAGTILELLVEPGGSADVGAIIARLG